MQRKFFQLFICLLILFPAIESVAQTPIEFNDKLVSITDSLYKKGSAWGTKFQEVNAGEKKDFKDLAPFRIEMQKFIDKKIAELQKTRAIGKGSQEFIQIMIQFLHIEKNLVLTAFVPMEKLNSGSSGEVMKTAIQNLTTESKKEEEELAKVNAAQQDYAEKNNFAIENDSDKDD